MTGEPNKSLPGAFEPGCVREGRHARKPANLQTRKPSSRAAIRIASDGRFV